MTLACVEQNLKTKSTFDSYDLLSGTSLQPLRTPRGPQILGEVRLCEGSSLFLLQLQLWQIGIAASEKDRRGGELAARGFDFCPRISGDSPNVGGLRTCHGHALHKRKSLAESSASLLVSFDSV